MAQLNAGQVRHVAKLARIELSEEQVSEIASQLTGILNHIDQLEGVDTEKVEPLTHPHDLRNVDSDDDLVSSLRREHVLQNAPKQDGEFYRVPAVIKNADNA